MNRGMTVPLPALSRGVARRYSRRALLSVAALLGSTGALGCAVGATTGSSGDASTGAQDSAQAGGRRNARTPVAVTYWKSLSGPRHDAQIALVDAFNAAQSSVVVAVEHTGEYNRAAEKLRTALASGTTPDVVMLATNTDMPAFARLGALQALESLVRADRAVQPETLYPGFLRDAQFAGHLYQLPFARSAPLLYVNLDVLRSTGVPERAPETWTEFLEVSRQVVRVGTLPSVDSVLESDLPPGATGAASAGTASAAGTVGTTSTVGDGRRSRYMGVGATTSWWELMPMLWSFGGAFSDERNTVKIDSAASVEGMTFLADLVHRHRVAVATKNVQPEFLRGDRAFMIGSSANLTQIMDTAPFRTAVAPVPVGGSAGSAGTGARAIPGGGSGLSVIASSPEKQKAGAWEFLRFMTSTPSAISFATATGYLPVRTDALNHPAMQQFVARYPGAKVAQAQLEYVRPVDGILATPFANTKIEAALTRLLFDGAAVRQTCETLAVELRQGAVNA